MRWDPIQRLFLVYRGGGDPAPQTTTSVNQMYSPEEAARRAKLMSQAEQLYTGAAATAAANPPGGPSADTTTSQNQLRTLAAQNPWAAQSEQLRNAQDFGFAAAMNPTAAPGFQATLDTATRKIDEKYSGPTGPFAGIRNAFAGSDSGGTGSREGIATGMAGRDYLNTIGDVTGRLTSDAYTKGLDVFSRTLGLAPQTMQAMNTADTMPANITGALGADAERRAEEQRKWELNSQWSAFAPYANAVMGAGPSQSSSTQTQSTGESSGWQQHAGAAMQGAAMFASTGTTGMVAGATAGLLLSLFS